MDQCFSSLVPVWHQEDRWFWLALLGSVICHLGFYALVNQEQPATTATATASTISNVTVRLVRTEAAEKSKSADISKTARPQIPNRKVKTPPHGNTKQPAMMKPVKSAESEQQLVIPITSGAENPLPQTARAVHDFRQDYLNSILAHIEAHKYYPQAARRRGISGQVRVSFNLLAQGEVADVDAKSAHVLLCHAARNAVQQAVPLPTSPEEIDLPMRVSFTMQYQLQ